MKDNPGPSLSLAVARVLTGGAFLGSGRLIGATGAFAAIGAFLHLAPAASFAVFAILLTVCQSAARFVGSWNTIAVQRDSGLVLEGELAAGKELVLVVAAALVTAGVVEVFRVAATRFGAFGGVSLPAAGLLSAALVLHASGLAHALARHRAGWAAAAEVARGTVFLGGAVYTYRVATIEPTGMLLLFAAAYGMSGLVGLAVLYNSSGSSGSASTLHSVVRRRMAYGVPMTFWSAMPPAIYGLERSAVSLVLGPAVGGVYAGVQELAVRGAYALCSPVIGVAHPRIMAFADRRPEVSLDRAFGLGFLALSVAGIVLGAAVALGLPMLGDLTPRTLRGVPLPVVGGIVAAGFVWQAALIAHKPIEISRKPWLMVRNLLVALVGGGAVWAFGLLGWGLVGAGVLASSVPLTYSLVCLATAPRRSVARCGSAEIVGAGAATTPGKQGS